MSLDERCVWGKGTRERCDNDAFTRRLCGPHSYMWPVEKYIHGTEPTESRITSDGYVQWRVDGLWHPAHRLVLARQLGRHLERYEVVIHKDNDRQNNDLDNLWLTDKSTAMKWRKDNPLPDKVFDEFTVNVRLVFKLFDNEGAEMPDADEARDTVRRMIGEVITGWDEAELEFYLDRYEIARISLEARGTENGA